jgi:hypothetical protein
LLRAASYSDQYGIYDVTDNAGWINLGMSHDTATFAVESIRRRWYGLGAACYPIAARLLINADCGGSNGARLRLWKRELQALANELGITICVSHLPPGTSKWNKIKSTACSRSSPRTGAASRSSAIRSSSSSSPTPEPKQVS